MSHFNKFMEYVRSEIGEIERSTLLAGPDSLEDIDRNLYAYGLYVIDQANKLDPELEVQSSNELDYAEHKNHFLQFYSDVQIGGRHYRVIIDECEFLYGKMAEDPMDFHNSTVAQIRSVIKNYHHILNHVESNLNEHYNPGEVRPDHE